MMTFFLICGGLGIILTLISVFSGFGDHDFNVDHDFDHEISGDHDTDAHHDSGPGLFSFRTIVCFLAAFGSVGAICTFYNIPPFLSSIFGFAGGAVIGLLAWWLMKQAYKQQASSLVTDDDIINLPALVTTAIPAGGNVGEISVEVKGQRKYYAAKTADGAAVPQGTTVIIKEVFSSALLVEPKK